MVAHYQDGAHEGRIGACVRLRLNGWRRCHRCPLVAPRKRPFVSVGFRPEAHRIEDDLRKCRYYPVASIGITIGF